MRPHSGIPKKVREAALRRQRTQERRFNEPLRIFLERKYPYVLSEFQQLYDWLNQQNPDRKSLTLMNTDAFKHWMLCNPLPSPDFPTPPVPTRLSSPPVQSEQISMPRLEIPLLSTSQISQYSPLVQPEQISLPCLEIPLLSTLQISQYSPPVQPEQPRLEISASEVSPPSTQISEQIGEDILGLAFREVFESVEPVSLEEVDVPEAILNELMENDFLRELLNSEEELPELRGLLDEELDEGIELSHVDEIVEDIEPFDFGECELF